MKALVVILSLVIDVLFIKNFVKDGISRPFDFINNFDLVG